MRRGARAGAGDAPGPPEVGAEGKAAAVHGGDALPGHHGPARLHQGMEHIYN